MTPGDSGQFDREDLKRWWEATRNYLFADPAREPGAADPSSSTPAFPGACLAGWRKTAMPASGDASRR